MIAINEFTLNKIGSVLLVLVAATITKAGLAAKWHDFNFAALAFIKGKPLTGIAAINNLFDLMGYDIAHLVRLYEVIPAILENLL